MSLGVLELNDAAVTFAADNVVLARSPGYAVLDKDQLLIGERAFAQARVLPSWSNNRFWRQLNTDPIHDATLTVRHHADLAFVHLESIWKQHGNGVDNVIVIVPGYYDRQQLALLLGIAKELRIPVSGFIDASLAAVRAQPLSDLVLHLSVHLHETTLTVLDAARQITRRHTITVADTGLYALWDRWANLIANQFVQTLRFDPLHDAATEQRLFDAVPGWIRQLDDQEPAPEFGLALDDVTHQAAISSDQLTNACTSLYPAIVSAIREATSGHNARLYLGAGFAGFPGLNDSLNLVDHITIGALPDTSAIDAVYEHASEIIGAGDGISHVVTLTLDAGSVAPASQLASPDKPTHVLENSRARPIGNVLKLSLGEADITLYADAGVMQLQASDGVVVNDEQTTVARVTAGDVIRSGDRQLTLITVE